MDKILLPPAPSSVLELPAFGECRQCRHDVGTGRAILNLKCRQCRQCRVCITSTHTRKRARTPVRTARTQEKKKAFCLHTLHCLHFGGGL